MNWMPFVTSAPGACFGAFFGALGAYWVGRFKENRDEQKRRHTALLDTQYALYSEWTVVEDIRKHLLEPLRNNPARHRHLVHYIRNVCDLRVPFSQLTFIIDSDTPNLLQEIHLAENQFLRCIALLEQVNELRAGILNKYPPIHFNKETGVGQLMAPDQVVHRLKLFTDHLYNSVDKALPALSKVNEGIFEFAQKNLKGKKALEFTPPENQHGATPRL